MSVIIPPIPKIPTGLSYEQRLEAYYAYCDELVKFNPRLMLSRGVRKKWWRFWVMEHPATSRREN